MQLIQKSIGMGIAVVALSSMTGIAHAQLTTYAIDRANNNIVSFDPLNPGAGVTAVHNPFTATPDPASGTGTFNGLAADTDTERIFFRSAPLGGNGSGNLFVWDGTDQRIITGSGLPGSATNAAFFGGAYWYIANTTDDLIKVDLDFTTPTAPTYTVTSFDNFDGITNLTSLEFGDIVVNSNGILYGSANNRFFTVDISSGSPTSFTTISTTQGIGMQMVFNEAETILYGARNVEATNSVNVFTVNPATGTETFVGSLAGHRFTDLAGIIPTGNGGGGEAPEPGTLALAVGGLGLMAGLMRRRK